MRAAYEETYANVHRGVYFLSQRSTDLFEDAREKVARFLNAPSHEEIVFTRNTTEAINLVAASWGRTFLREGDEIVISALEHHANVVRSEEHTSELQSLMRISYADFYLKKKKRERFTTTAPHTRRQQQN